MRPQSSERRSARLDGDSPGTAVSQFNAGNSTFASVDSELTLLFQDLETGESGGLFDSGADNVIVNPFFNATQSITASDRSGVTSAVTFATIPAGPGAIEPVRELADPGGSGAFDPTGSIFLTSRLDGASVQDVVDSIARAQRAEQNGINSTTAQVLIDENVSGELDDFDVLPPFTSRSINPDGDFEQLNADLQGVFENVVFDETSAFLIGDNGGVSAAANPQAISGDVAGLVVFGGNHNPGSGATESGFLASFVDENGDSQFVDGALFLATDSVNAREFGGLPQFSDQESLADFIAAGGTFTIGNVFEPFTLSLAEADILFDRFFDDDFTFVEAAFASIPFLSGQTIVIGDPLARVSLVVPEPASSALLFAAGACLAGSRSRRRS